MEAVLNYFNNEKLFTTPNNTVLKVCYKCSGEHHRAECHLPNYLDMNHINKIADFADKHRLKYETINNLEYKDYCRYYGITSGSTDPSVGKYMSEGACRKNVSIIDKHLKPIIKSNLLSYIKGSDKEVLIKVPFATGENLNPIIDMFKLMINLEPDMLEITLQVDKNKFYTDYVSINSFDEVSIFSEAVRYIILNYEGSEFDIRRYYTFIDRVRSNYITTTESLSIKDIIKDYFGDSTNSLSKKVRNKKLSMSLVASEKLIHDIVNIEDHDERMFLYENIISKPNVKNILSRYAGENIADFLTGSTKTNNKAIYDILETPTCYERVFLYKNVLSEPNVKNVLTHYIGENIAKFLTE